MKKNYVTIVCLLIICAAAVMYATSDRDTQQTPQRLSPYVNPADIESISIARGDQNIELIPRGTQWFMQYRDHLIAVEAAAMLNLLDFINTGTILQRVTKNPDTYSRFDITDESALIITLQTKGQRTKLYVGKSKDQASQFVRLPDDPGVYLVSKTLDTGPEPWRWYYRRMLQYAPDLLDAILYDCGQQTLHLQRDGASGKLTARDVPKGKTPVDHGKLAEHFNDLSIADYVPRAGAPKAKELVTHTLNFTDGSSATLRFLDKNDEEDLPPFLDIVFGEKEPTDEKLRYAKDISERYIFSLSWIDTTKYQKACEEFFTDPPPAEPDEKGGEVLKK
jgi:hypothetical protein